MKRTLISSTVAIVLSSSINVEAGTAGLTGVWTGEYIWTDYDSGGGYDFGADTPQFWSFDFDNGTADIVNTYPVYTGTYIFHDTTFTDNNDGTYSGLILLDVIGDSYEYYDIQLDITWDITDTGIVTTWPYYVQIPYDSPWMPNSLMSFDGSINRVPIPPAIWLFGSGLLGLIGISRRAQAA